LSVVQEHVEVGVLGGSEEIAVRESFPAFLALT
jgi:hypothetical protein